MNDQWQLIAHDLDKTERSSRISVLSQILDGDIEVGKRPRTVHHNKDINKTLKLRMNQLLTDFQIILINKLRISVQKVSLAARSIYDFERRIAIKFSPKETVWPLIEILE